MFAYVEGESYRIAQGKKENKEKHTMNKSKTLKIGEDFPEFIWEKRVKELEELGATTSDAQAVADAEMEKLCSWGWAKN